MSNRNSLIVACITGDLEMLEKHIAEHQDRDDYNFLNENGLSPLHVAIAIYIESNSHQIVKNLLNTQLVDQLQETSFGLNCLSLAVLLDEDSSDIIKLLLENDINFQLADQFIEHCIAFAEQFDNKLRTVIETLKSRNYTAPNTMNIRRIAAAIMRASDPEKFRYFILENMNFITNDKQRAKEMLVLSNYALYLELTGSSNHEQSKWLEVLGDVFLIIFNEYPDDWANHLLESLIVMR